MFVTDMINQSITLKAIEVVKNKYKREVVELTTLSQKSFIHPSTSDVLVERASSWSSRIQSLEDIKVLAQQALVDIDDLPNVDEEVRTEIKIAVLQVVQKMLSPQNQIVEMVNAE